MSYVAGIVAHASTEPLHVYLVAWLDCMWNDQLTRVWIELSGEIELPFPSAQSARSDAIGRRGQQVSPGWHRQARRKRLLGKTPNLRLQSFWLQPCEGRSPTVGNPPQSASLSGPAVGADLGRHMQTLSLPRLSAAFCSTVRRTVCAARTAFLPQRCPGMAFGPWHLYRKPTSFEQLADNVWADDISRCIEAPSCWQLGSAVSAEAGIVSTGFNGHGFRLAYGGKENCSSCVPCRCWLPQGATGPLCLDDFANPPRTLPGIHSTPRP